MRLFTNHGRLQTVKWLQCHSNEVEAEASVAEVVVKPTTAVQAEVEPEAAGPEPPQSEPTEAVVKGAVLRHTHDTKHPDIRMGLPSRPA